MVFEDLVGALPLWLAITLFLSYVTWAKYLNLGELRPHRRIYPQKIDATIVIFVIFVIVLAVTWSLSIILYFFFEAVNEFDGFVKFREFAFSGESVGLTIIFIDVAIFLLLASTIYKTNKKKDLERIFNYSFLTFFCFVSFLVGSSFYFIKIGSFYYTIIYLALVFFIFASIGVIILLLQLGKGTSKKRYFSGFIDFTSTFGKGISSILILGFLIGGFIVSFFITPVFSHADITQRYIINDDFWIDNSAKIDIERKFHMNRTGYFLKLTFLNLKGLNLDRDKTLYFSSSVINETGGKEWKSEKIDLAQQERGHYSKFGMLDYRYFENSSLWLKIDKNMIKSQIKDVYVKGTSIGDVSKSFIVNYSKLMCENSNCFQNISFINNLDYPVEKDQEVRIVPLLKYNKQLFEKRCNLTNVSDINPEKSRVEFKSRHEDSSFIYSIKKYRQTGDYKLFLTIQGSMLRSLYAYQFKIQNNSRVDLTFHYTCS